MLPVRCLFPCPLPTQTAVMPAAAAPPADGDGLPPLRSFFASLSPSLTDPPHRERPWIPLRIHRGSTGKHRAVTTLAGGELV
jgi:hypothetical protein